LQRPASSNSTHQQVCRGHVCWAHDRQLPEQLLERWQQAGAHHDRRVRRRACLGCGVLAARKQQLPQQVKRSR
jgi:hypothetical protein